MDEATARYGIEPGTLTLHQDRGSPMIAHGVPGSAAGTGCDLQP